MASSIILSTPVFGRDAYVLKVDGNNGRLKPVLTYNPLSAKRFLTEESAMRLVKAFQRTTLRTFNVKYI